MKKDFNEFRFAGLGVRQQSNKYLTTERRVNDEETKIVVKVADSHIIPTRFGYALILDQTHVVFLKEWQVDQNWYGNEVVLDKNYFVVKEWGDHQDFFENEEALNFEYWLETAKVQQDADNAVCWRK